MTKEEAAEKLQDILDEATAYEHAVCYVTIVDKEPLTMAIESLKTEAIPVEWMRQYIDEHGLYTTAMEAITAWSEQRKEE